MFSVFRNRKTTTTVFALSFLGRSRAFHQGFLSPLQKAHKFRDCNRSLPPSPLILTSFLTNSALRFSSSSIDTSEMKKRVLVPISDGSEEIETCCITDTLTRFGADVVVASVKPDGELKCKMSRGIQVRCVKCI